MNAVAVYKQKGNLLFLHELKENAHRYPFETCELKHIENKDFDERKVRQKRLPRHQNTQQQQHNIRE